MALRLCNYHISESSDQVSKLNNKLTYTVWVLQHQIKSLLKGRPGDGVKNAIGGNFDSLGQVMRDLLVDRGLSNDSYLIDVGCGSGRLTKQVDSYLTEGRYLGLDIIRKLVKHASSHTQRPNFDFRVSSGFDIPEQNECADIVCFFSVFTHLLHEQTFLYLQDAKRVLKGGGKIVFSFLEFPVAEHWPVFENNVKNAHRSYQHLNMFIGRDAIACWAEKLDMEIEGIWDGDKPHIPLSATVVTDEGTRMEKMGWLGQSVCVLTKKL